MKSTYIPKELYEILENNPDFSVLEIRETMKCSRATAYRYKKGFKLFNKYRNKYLIHHKINKVKIEKWKLINNQENDLEKIIISILNNTGFKSTKELREIFYKQHPKYKHQSDRNFNRYFKKVRDKLNKDKYKLEILKSDIKIVGFFTQVNLNFKPTDY